MIAMHDRVSTRYCNEHASSFAGLHTATFEITKLSSQTKKTIIN
jgi:hypothetical protein